MIIQVVKFETELPEEEILGIAKGRFNDFAELPGLLQKYYVKLQEPNHYGGVYVWDSRESLLAFRESDLAASIPRAYGIKGQPTVEVYESLFELRASD